LRVESWTRCARVSSPSLPCVGRSSGSVCGSDRREGRSSSIAADASAWRARRTRCRGLARPRRVSRLAFEPLDPGVRKEERGPRKRCTPRLGDPVNAHTRQFCACGCCSGNSQVKSMGWRLIGAECHFGRREILNSLWMMTRRVWTLDGLGRRGRPRKCLTPGWNGERYSPPHGVLLGIA
jgi:hypothetical protein